MNLGSPTSELPYPELLIGHYCSPFTGHLPDDVSLQTNPESHAQGALYFSLSHKQKQTRSLSETGVFLLGQWKTVV